MTEQLIEIYLMTDQAEQCRICGSRTEFQELTPSLQYHRCLNSDCNHVYCLEDDVPFADFQQLQEPTTSAALRALIAYLWDDELSDFAHHPSDDHIFRQLVILRNSFEATSRTADEHAADHLQQHVLREETS